MRTRSPRRCATFATRWTARRRTSHCNEPAALIGVAGTVTTVAAVAMGLDCYDPGRIHGATVTAPAVDAVTTMLLAMTHDQRAALPVMHTGRIDVIGGGALIPHTLMTAMGCPRLSRASTTSSTGLPCGSPPRSSARTRPPGPGDLARAAKPGHSRVRAGGGSPPIRFRQIRRGPARRHVLGHGHADRGDRRPDDGLPQGGVRVGR